MMQDLKRHLLAVSKWTWGIWEILTQALKSLKNFHFNGLLLNKVYMFEQQKYRGVMFDDTEHLFKIREKTDLSFQNGMKNLANFHKLKNSHFILESKMAELNHNKNSKQLDQSDALRKLYFTLEIND